MRLEMYREIGNRIMFLCTRMPMMPGFLILVAAGRMGGWIKVDGNTRG